MTNNNSRRVGNGLIDESNEKIFGDSEDSERQKPYTALMVYRLFQLSVRKWSKALVLQCEQNLTMTPQQSFIDQKIHIPEISIII